MANASMRDVAARAGVSVATVSHVINNTRYVAEGTRERVQAAIEELNYNPDTMARIFKTGRTNLVGFVVPNISDPFFSTLIEEVESVLSRQNYRLVVTNSHEDEQREIENLRFLCNGLVDGIIIASAQRSYESIQKVLPENFPIVFIDRTVAFCPKDVIRVNTYSTVLEAQLAGIEALEAGVPGNVVDKAARDIIEKAGYGSCFGHGLGHSLGLNIHENPRAAKSYTRPFVTGNIITIEPGIYIPGSFGVRIEDMVYLGADKKRNLTAFPKDLCIL